MNIVIRIKMHDRKDHHIDKGMKLTCDRSMGRTLQEIESVKNYVLDSIIDWFEEFENQPRAKELHPQ